MSRRTIAVTLLLALAAVLGGAPAGAAGSRPVREWPEGWSRERTVGEASPYSLRKQAIAGIDGRLNLLWIDTIGGAESVLLTTLFQGEPIGQPVRISSVSGGIKAVGLSKDTEGNLYAVWVLRSESRFHELHLAKLDGNGKVIVPDHVILSGEGLLEDPGVVADSQGNIHIFWGDWRGPNYRLFSMTLSPDAIAVRNEPKALDVPGTTPGTPVACYDRFSSQIHLVWTATYEGSPSLWHMRISDAGTPLSAPRRIGPWYSGEKGLPAAALDRKGNLHLIWIVFQSGGGLSADRRSLYYARISSDGTMGVAPLQIASPGGNPCWPSVAVDSSGRAHGVWSDSTSAAFQAYYLQLNEAGLPKGAPQLLDISSSASLAAQAAVDPQGQRYVFWTRFNEGDRRGSIAMVDTLHPAHASVWRRAGLDEQHPLGSAIYTAASVLLVYVMPLVTLSALIPAVLLIILWGLGRLGVKIDGRRHWLAFSLVLTAAILVLEETPLFLAHGRYLGLGFDIGSIVLSGLTTLVILRPRKLGTLETVGGKIMFVVVFLSCQVFLTMLGAQVAGIGW